MRKLLLSLFLLVCLGMAGAYSHWANQRGTSHYLSDLRIRLAVNEGTPGPRGNLLGIQAELFAPDYQDVARLRLKLQAYLRQARALGVLNPRTVVVLPEHIGTWLWLRGEKREFYQASEHSEASHWLAISHPLSFAWAWLGAADPDRSADARLRLKARHMAHEYQRLFSGLAQEFNITLVAGSVVLPAPHLAGGELKTSSGPLYNTTLVFAANGEVLGQPLLQREAQAMRGVADAAAAAPQLFDTPAGRLGVLLGRDALDPAKGHELQAAGAQLVAIPAFLDGPDAWARDGKLWQNASPALPTMAVFMHGRFWDRRSQGQSFVGQGGPAREADAGPGAQLLNLWL